MLITGFALLVTSLLLMPWASSGESGTELLADALTGASGLNSLLLFVPLAFMVAMLIAHLVWGGRSFHRPAAVCAWAGAVGTLLLWVRWHEGTAHMGAGPWLSLLGFVLVGASLWFSVADGRGSRGRE